jgi:hypothetical protein
MSYLTINQCANDASFQGRVTACAAQEGATDPNATMMYHLRWPVASSADIEAAYESAVAADNPDPGGDPAVITDQMILSAVQASWPETP